jgi:hypothetical protein
LLYSIPVKNGWDTQIQEIKNSLSTLEDVVGIGISSKQGIPTVTILVRKENQDTRKRIVKLLGEIPYEIRISGEFKALDSDAR